jgi:hypothetical protein
MQGITFGILVSGLVASAPAAAETVSLACAASGGAQTYYLTLDYDNATVTMRDWGTYRATIGDREITWSNGSAFNRLERETGRFEIHNSDYMTVMQCHRGEPSQRF